MRLFTATFNIKVKKPLEMFINRPNKVNDMFLRHRPRHFQPPPASKILLHSN